jgi:hypothetical protein
MAPLSNNTRRWWLDYSTCGHGHTLLMRSSDPVDAAEASAAIGSFLGDLSTQLREITITGFRTAAKGSDVSLPATWGGAATYGSGTGSEFESAQYLDFVGRDEAGRRVRVAVFGVVYSEVGNNYRVTTAESTAVVDALADLVGDPECFLTISELNPVWHTYANVGQNAYWRNKIR